MRGNYKQPMTGLSLGLTQDLNPPLSSCVGCAKAEAEIRALLTLISNNFSKNPSEFLGFKLPRSEPVDHLQLFHLWIQKFDSDPKFPMCPDLKKRVKALVFKLLNERTSIVSLSALGCRKRKGDEVLVNMLTLLKSVAVSPCDDLTGDDQESKDKILKARKALFLKVPDVSNVEEFPYLKKRRTRQFLNATNSGPNSHPLVNDPIRRSQRTLLKFGDSDLPRKHIPIGPAFQADVPDWKIPPNKGNVSDGKDELNDSRWFGVQIWPIEGVDRRVSEGIIGQGKPYLCNCISQGSVECIKFHVSMARLHLKSDLGPAFFSLGFGEMGEEVSKSWTQEEQMEFDDLVRQNPSSQGRSFLDPALKYFASKSRHDIVSFYFNVFVLRWMRIRTKLGALTVDSGDDESLGWV